MLLIRLTGLISIFLLILPITGKSAMQAELLKDIYPGGYGSNPGSITNVNGQAYLTAHSANNYGEAYGIWKTDGTEDGTQFVADIDMPDQYFNYEEFTSFNGQLFFRGFNVDNGFGKELWKSDGSQLGTIIVKDIHISGDSNPRHFTKFDQNTMFFYADSEDEGTELWQTDGTTVGTSIVKVIFPGPNSTSINEYGPLAYGYSSSAIVNGIYYFSAATPNNEQNIGGNELWRSDGTSEGTYMVTDLTPYYVPVYGTQGHSHPNHLTSFKNKLFFSAYSQSTGTELFVSDGTEGGTTVLAEICPNLGESCGGGGGANGSYPQQLIVAGNYLYFFAYDGVSPTKRLWRTDGTAQGTRQVTSMPEGAHSTTVDNLMAFNDALYFTYHDGDDQHGNELWRTDGNTTALVKDIGTGLDLFERANSSNPSNLTVVGNQMYFSAWSDGNGRELWQTDGTEAGTSMVVDMSANTTNMFGHLIIGSSHPSNLANINGTLYFSAEPWNYLDYSNVGRELWKLTYVPDIFEGINSDDTQGLASVIQLDDTNPQLHNFHDAADKDWIKFFAVGGKKYQIDTGNVGPVVDLVIKIHDGSGILLTTVDQTGQGEVEETEWLAPANGVYYVEFSEKQDLYGSGTEYEATISFKYAPGSFGIIRGIVQSDQGAVKLAGALVTSKINNVTDSAVMTLPDGSYIIVSTAGQINLSTQLSGYLPVTQQGINVLAGSDIEVNLTLSEMPENTDTDGDGIPDDEDDFSDNAAASIDSDSDGLPDEWNAACFLDCLNNSGLTVDNDDDNDGMPDDYEIANDLEPFSDDSLADSDNDGYTNLEEFEAGTAANDANDTPRKSNVILKILPLLLEQ